MINEETTFGYVHTVSITDSNQDFLSDIKLKLRLDTDSAIPGYTANNAGTKADTIQFIKEHLINILYISYTYLDEESAYNGKYCESCKGLKFAEDEVALSVTDAIGVDVPTIIASSMEEITE